MARRKKKPEVKIEQLFKGWSAVEICRIWREGDPRPHMAILFTDIEDMPGKITTDASEVYP